MAVRLRRRRRAPETRTAVRRREEPRTRRGRTARIRRWQRHDGLSAFVWLLAWIATLVLLFGIALTWGGADPRNETVHAVLRAGGWLATPFTGLSGNDDARVRLTEDWAVAAGVYLIAGRILAWLLRW